LQKQIEEQIVEKIEGAGNKKQETRDKLHRDFCALFIGAKKNEQVLLSHSFRGTNGGRVC